ncbi:MAG: elongation factor 4 [Bdellovibrionales bacterium RIFOXYD12_FULL_39_22]|nr:MAG: elongation factor 4 [Bdellovibrionales bacterium RIFOXYB1_FULL_39_21]OFZ41724.1 MAG: elongation factor 4 [Bdellovibrionales bacterium RIFOXYC12_FULL_39_17]OFZ46124.1 MAG: elongation factor 4 [Bdellovibrionales bacterium RIFOXYC1_FULL_39_130]OFZ69031.1 MAG: elongation factor 4 [Bdellovibrionales bacterium RIFOXYC2_FULL_39_8]OFZ74951.1 MAG: elongation factor 4 [Bdellovibrionales bacterium RIFOXYD1_FULL_39_84]OFZ92804.1 MAG: elongation factor 4 [Bdellovibrionales bacterium RIFOXYD12_FULL_
MDIRYIRNFSIIAHIDHGKSTLADRLLEATNTISEREKTDQFLDNMDIERERGITIKAQTVRLKYQAQDGNTYFLNLIDTPGHVDFSYEVSRSLASCDGAILVVDASQGVEAQTLANVYMAIDNNLEILPVINKIDLPHADVERAKKEIEEIIGIDASAANLVSAKTGIGITDLLESIVQKVPHPKGGVDNDLQALIFDSWFDPYKGVIVLVRVFQGTVKIKDKVFLKNGVQEYEVLNMGVNAPFYQEVTSLGAGEVGMLICGIKTVRDVKIGDTIVHARKKDTPLLDGFKESKPMVFCGVFPVESTEYAQLKESLEKLALNDSSFTYEPETSNALGFGFRCGFLGLLHMNIIQERLEREFEQDLISTAPSCRYQVMLTSSEMLEIENPADLPEANYIEEIQEPIVEISIHIPNEYVGRIIKLCEDRRGAQKEIKYITADRVQVIYDIPLNEMVFDFYDKLKGISKGYASMDYEVIGYRQSDLIKLDILLNGDKVDALSLICHRDQAVFRGRALVQRLQKVIERQQFDIAIQAAIGARVVARESVKALRKNVLAKCYGGDVSRKRKLLEKQKRGKKRMKMVGNVEVSQEAFLAVLKIEE